MPTRRPKDATALLPLKQSIYRVLLAMPDGESMHGYAIMQAVSEMTQGRDAILPGTLYVALARMVEEGLVEALGTPKDDASGGPARSYYRRTAFGRAVARAESERLRALLDIAVARKIIGERK
jgi:DNA-binding PadR family transcriptional regulator